VYGRLFRTEVPNCGLTPATSPRAISPGATAARRALGYAVEETYFVPSGKIEGTSNLKRAREFISSDGSFRDARFEKRPATMSPSKWDLDAFSGTRLVKGVKDGRLQLVYRGLAGSELESVPLEHARWFAGLLGQLSDQQLRDALQASGASEAEVEGYSAKLRERIRELQTAVDDSPPVAMDDR
jgi:hypothetical protein